MNTHTLLWLLIAFIFSACSPGHKQKDGIPVVFFEKTTEILPHEIIETAFIKLETTDDCLLGLFSQIQTTEDLLLIQYNDKIYAYGKQGNFIAQIDHKGGGPGEYLSIASFFINEKEGLICLIDSESKKILSYRLDDFQLISERKIPFATCSASLLADGNIIWRNQEYLPEGVGVDYYFIKTDKNLNILERYVEKQFISGYTTGDQNSIYRIGNKVFAYTPFSPVIYEIAEDGMYPSFQLKFSERQFPPIEFLQKESANNRSYFKALIKSDYVSHYNVRESEHDLCVFYIAHEERFIGMYDKLKKQSYHYTFDDFRNDLKVGTPFSYVASGQVDGYYVIPLIPASLKEQKKEGYQFAEPLNTFIDQSEEDDNPILFLFKLKNNE